MTGSPLGVVVQLKLVVSAMDKVTMYPDLRSKSQQLYNRALSSLPGGNTRTTVFMKPYPIYAARGEGCRVIDLDGNAYIDCINTVSYTHLTLPTSDLV